MKVINDSRRLPESQLHVIAAVGWICVLYLAWVVGRDSFVRTMFAMEAIAGRLPELDPFNQRYVDNPRLTLLHTIPGVLFAILGPLQFVGPLRRRFPAVHRFSGRVFLTIGIGAGIAAFLMTFRFPVWGMPANFAISAGFAVFMVFAFVKALAHARARRFVVHREWMIRGFATGMSVAFFRVLLDDVLPALGMASFDARWNTVMAVSFPIMIGVAELWIRATRPRKRAAEPVAAPATSSA